MRRIMLLLWLQFKSLARPGIIVGFILLAPLLLGLISGYGNKMNYSESIQVAIVDLDKSDASTELIDDISAHGWDVHTATQNTAKHLLAMGSVETVIEIGDAFDEFIGGRADDADIHFEQTDYSLMQVTIRQSVLLNAETRRTVQLMEQGVTTYRERHDENTETVENEMSALMEYYRKNEGAMPIHYINRPPGPLRRTIVVGDFSLEVLYLAVLAVIAVTAQKFNHKRLLSTPFAAPLSVVLSYLVWLLLGLIQIVLFTFSMSYAMGNMTVLRMVFPLVSYYALLLAIFSWLRHLDTDIGLYLGLFVSFLLSLLGGVFFPLPGPLLSKVARYTPLGWIYAYQSGMANLPIWSIWLVAALVLSTLAWTFSRPKRYN